MVAEFREGSTRAADVRGFYLNPKSIPIAGQGDTKKFTEIRVRIQGDSISTTTTSNPQ